MNREDYNKFYIQGSDHYLIPKDVFNELFDEMESWKQDTQKHKEVIDKTIELLNNHTILLPTEYSDEVANFKRNLRNILKEVK